MRYLLTTYHWPLLSRPQVAGFKCPVTDLRRYCFGNKLVETLVENVLAKLVAEIAKGAI